MDIYDYWKDIDCLSESEKKVEEERRRAVFLEDDLSIRQVVSSVRAGKTLAFKDLQESSKGKGQPTIWGNGDAPVKKKHEEQQLPQLSEKSQPVFPVLESLLKELSYSSDIELVRARMLLGVEKYGQELHSFNGRDCQRDAIEEILDCMQYVSQLFMERTYDPLTFNNPKHNKTRHVYRKVIEHLLEAKAYIEDSLD